MDRIKYLLLFVLLTVFTSAGAQNARQARSVLDKTAAVVGRKGGASAHFAVSGRGRLSGTIYIKGNRFYANTGSMKVWYNGRTQWSYLRSTNEVNISTPNAARQMSMNPLKFINLYKTGYALSMNRRGGSYVVHMKATNRGYSIQEIYITISSAYQPRQVKMRTGGRWTTISISNFRAHNLGNSLFVFNKRYCPSAEIIDLR